MLAQIIIHTPAWVWGLLIALLWLGFSQTRTRRVTLRRITVMLVAMTGLSLYGTVSAFGLSAPVLLAWLVAASALLATVMQRRLPADTGYEPEGRSFTVPGSWVPMVLILGIFLTKYIVGVELAMQPALARDGQFTLIVGALYGVFSGIFAGRAARLWRLTRRPAPINATPALNT